MKYNPHPYQQHSTQHIIDNDAAGLFLEMGLGKTVSTLTAKIDMTEGYKTLIVAPKRVCEDTWPLEIEKWDHTAHLTYSLILGSEKQRKEALKKKADIYIINVDNIAWLVSHYGLGWPFEWLILDELSCFKSPKSIRFKALKRIRPLVKKITGLTGTPSPNGLLDLWSQLYLLDQGQRLGKTITEYRKQYFNEGQKKGYTVFNYKLKGDETRSKGPNGRYLDDGLLGDDIYQKEIFDKIGDICISMQSKDYLKLPERIDVNRVIKFSQGVRDQYDKFEEEQVLAMNDLENITAANAAALSNKLLQFSNGAVYDSERKVHEIHDEKLEALEEIVDNANGEPVLVLYAYRHDVDRIMSRLKGYKPQEIKDRESIKQWNEGKIRVMCGHPKSMGHGLNLQAGGCIVVWFGLNWSLELYQQANSRLHRQGQTKPVIIHHLLCKGTMDEEVMEVLSGKEKTQDALMRAVKARIQKYVKQ